MLKEARDIECYFWFLASAAEIDLVIIKDIGKYGFEIKYSDKPMVTKSMISAISLKGAVQKSVSELEKKSL